VDEHLKAVVTEFLKLGLFEEWISSERLRVVDSFGLSEEALVAEVRAYQANRQNLLAFQQFLESRVQQKD
jgi:hypothetical protein